MRFRTLTLALLALSITLRAEDPNAPKKKPAAAPPRVQPVPRAVSPRVLSSTALSEVLATNLTLAPGADQFFTAMTDFTGADMVSIGFYGDVNQDFSKTNYVSWWAIPGSPNYNAADYWAGSNFPYLNSGSVRLGTFGNQLLVEIKNNSANPITFTQITIWAIAR